MIAESDKHGVKHLEYRIDSVILSVLSKAC